MQAKESSGVQRVYLVGYMGSGKSTWGKKLARRLGYDFIDLDSVIVSETGMPIPVCFEKFGESSFRDLESAVLRSLDPITPTVIATGGGTPCFFDNISWMKESGVVVYLQLSAKALWQRLQRSDIATRPMLAGLSGAELLDQISTRLSERAPYYRQSHVVVDQLKAKIGDVAQMISDFQK